MRPERRVAAGMLHIAIDGVEGAPWIVFSNSLATDLSLWDAQVAALDGNYRILRYDYRGHGGSPPTGGTCCDIRTLASDLLAVMDAAGIDRAHHVGVSMGSLAGIAAAAGAPARFRSLVICNARLRSSPSSAASLEQRASLALSQGMQGLVGITLEKWFGQPSPHPDAGVRSRVGAMIRSVSAPSYALYAGGSLNYDLERVLGSLALPMVFIAGTRDGDVASEFARVAGGLRDARYEPIEGAGHLPNIEAPERFNRALAEFLSAAGEQ